MSAITQLTAVSIQQGLRELAARDELLARLWQTYGDPPLWFREPGFPALINIILEQQVSQASGRAAFERLLKVAEPLTPESFLALEESTLKAVGFSRQKIRYGRLLSEAVLAGKLDLAQLAELPDRQVRQQLTSLKGIGPWTAEIYLLMCLRRPDTWPSGDLALAEVVKQVLNLPDRPSFNELERIAEPWRPWRGVAARLWWHVYLANRR